MENKKYTLITGASGGIGYELALLSAADGNNLILVARSGLKLEALAAEIRERFHVDARVKVADLADASGVKDLIDSLVSEKLSVDILINNAGFGDFGDFAEANLERNLEMIRLNIGALTHLSHAVLKGMKAAGKGKILNVASIASFMPGPGMAVYYASKAFVLSFSEALSRELKGSGVTVTALCPGPTDTGFAVSAGLGKSLLHKILPAATSAEVARAGYRAMNRGCVVVVPGFMNKMSAFVPRLSPRFMVRNMIYSIHKNH
jgi:uncharacterized protein